MPKAKTPAIDLEEIGTSGVNRWGGYVNDEFIRELQGRRGMAKYREMAFNDYAVWTMMFALQQLIARVSWSVAPSDPNDAEAVEIAEFVDSCRQDMSHSWDDAIDRASSMLTYGWAFLEIVYKKRDGQGADDSSRRSRFDDGRVGWRKLALRRQDTLLQWRFDDAGGILGMEQQAPPNYKVVFIPIERALLFRTTIRDENPEGLSALRGAYRPWYFKKRIEEIEGIGIERDLAGLPTLALPSSYMTPDAPANKRAVYELLKKLVTSVRRDEREGVLLPSDRDANGNKLFEFSLLTTGGKRNFDTSEIINRYARSIFMTALADFIMLGSEKAGSYALSVDKTDMFADAVGGWLKKIADVMTTHAVPKLLAVNGLPLDKSPRVIPGDVKRADLEVALKTIEALARSGATMFPTPSGAIENTLLERAGLPLLDED